MLRNIPITQTSTSKVANTSHHITTSSRTLPLTHYKSSPNSTKHHGRCFYNFQSSNACAEFPIPHPSYLSLQSTHPTKSHHLQTTTHIPHHKPPTSPLQSSHTRLQSQLPYHIHSTIPHTVTHTNEGQSWTYTHYYCCSDLLWYAIAMHMLCDSIMSQSICIALYLAMSSLP